MLPTPHQLTEQAWRKAFFASPFCEWLGVGGGAGKTKPKETGGLFGWRQRGTANSQTYYVRDNEGCAYAI